MVARIFGAVLAFALLASAASPAHAYRPFDGTDADTASPREFELELGPVHYYRQRSQDFLIAPAVVLNFGLFQGTELVIDAQQHWALGKLPPSVPRSRLRGDDVLLKHVFLPGTLQGEGGLSIAVEAGLLTPETHTSGGFGASSDLITSWAGPWGALHWNEWFQFTRDHHADLFSGLILEGPRRLVIRPVAELFYERDFVEGYIASALFGAIVCARDDLSIDAGLRAARLKDGYVAEARLGLTWSISFSKQP